MHAKDHHAVSLALATERLTHFGLNLNDYTALHAAAQRFYGVEWPEPQRARLAGLYYIEYAGGNRWRVSEHGTRMLEIAGRWIGRELAVRELPTLNIALDKVGG
jgi:hypothetical protein